MDELDHVSSVIIIAACKVTQKSMNEMDFRCTERISRLKFMLLSKTLRHRVL